MYAGRRRDRGSRGARDRLDHDRGDVARAAAQKGILELARGPGRLLLRRAAAADVGVRHRGHGMLVEHRLVERPPLGARERERAVRRAVERRPARDQVGLARTPAQLPVAPGELDRRLDRLRAGRVEEAPGVGQRRDGAQLLGELQHRPVAEREAVGERELGDLPLHDLDEPGVAVAERHDHRPAAGVEVAAAVLVDDARAARAGRHLEQRARATRSARSRHGVACATDGSAAVRGERTAVRSPRAES